ncbi:pseudouridine synthase [Rhodobacteraceae bacterium KMM 6894]|nr:pseudouridine synthase [Rhodobacteraceae bacterium KMM 6894]
MSNTPPPGERIAKVIARSGVASRREAERLIETGCVTVNGTVIDRAALNVTDSDRIAVNGRPLDAPEPARLWLYHKPTGLVTTNKDEKGRETIYDALPDDLPRVITVGRLDINSEGLLLLTNDGGLKRKLELPSTGWLRKYRVRVNGRPTDATFAPLREGLTVDGEHFAPMTVTLDRQKGANAWITIALREGKNREVRRAMEAVGLIVNRLIRVSYGPFQLGQLKPGAVEEIRPRVLRDQLGIEAPVAEPAPGKPNRMVQRKVGSGRSGSGKAAGTTAKTGAKPGTGRVFTAKTGSAADRTDRTDRTERPDKPWAANKAASGKPAARKPAFGKPAFGKPASGKPATGKPASGRPTSGKPASGRPSAGKTWGGKPSGGGAGKPGGPARGPAPRGRKPS